MFNIKEWYLITPESRPNLLGGFENEAYTDYKNDAFVEVLETDIASTVILYNSDLSKKKTIRCVIQGNMADTHLKSMERTGLFTIGTVKSGMYIYFENRYWLITGYPGNDGICEKATLSLCQYKLRWQNRAGRIIERWISATSASKYNTGESSNRVITLSSNNFTILIPDDNDGLGLDGKRVFIDKDKLNPTRVFKVTRSDEILYDYGEEHGGILSFIVTKTEFNPQTDNQKLLICDYIKPIHKSHNYNQISTLPFAHIKGNRILKCGYKRTYAVEFMDSEKNPIDFNLVDFNWQIISDFEIKQETKENKITLFVVDENLIGGSFLLQIISDNNIICSEKIDITDVV